jgi:hypothetical protein
LCSALALWSAAVTHAKLPPPTEAEIAKARAAKAKHILRTELDPRGQNTGERGTWIVYDADSGTYTRAEG